MTMFKREHLEKWWRLLAFNSNIILSLLENFGWNLAEEKFKIQLFDGDVCPMSIDSVCINYEEEENSDSEYESDSNVFWQWWKIIFQFSSKTQTTPKTIVGHNF